MECVHNHSCVHDIIRRHVARTRALLKSSTFVFFSFQENYVPDSEEGVTSTRAQFDVILALSITKWVHLNWGDAGLRRMFRKMFHHLRPGGRLILEPQPFNSYARKKKLTVSPLQVSLHLCSLFPAYLALMMSVYILFHTACHLQELLCHQVPS